MKLTLVDPKLEDYLKKRGLKLKFIKQKKVFEKDFSHPSLKTKLLEPKKFKVWSFRIDHKYRAIFAFIDKNTAIVFEINNHYK